MSIDRHCAELAEELLLGVFAYRLGLLSGEAFERVADRCLASPQKSFPSVAESAGELTSLQRQLLAVLVREHVSRNEGDAIRSLARSEFPPTLLPKLAVANGSIEQLLYSKLIPLVPVQDPGDNPPQPKLDLLANRFEILRPHARGGLGEVFLAYDHQLKREVALKEILSERSNSTSNRTRFLAEAEITSKLEHPGIVPVYSFGTHADGRPFYAMRFVEGNSFRASIEELHYSTNSTNSKAGPNTKPPSSSPIPTSSKSVSRSQRRPTPISPVRNTEFKRLLVALISVCETIHFAHGKGVIHRDLKPSNIMLGVHGEVVVVDWGLAKVTGTPLVPSEYGFEGVIKLDADANSLTATGARVGTIEYMPPEHANSDQVCAHPAADIFSLGATLYHLLTGKAPYAQGDSQSRLKNAQSGSFSKPRELNYRIPQPLEAITLKAMAIAPDDRYQSALELANDLKNWLAGGTIAAWDESTLSRMLRWHQSQSRLTQFVSLALPLALLVASLALLIAGRERFAWTQAAAERSEIQDDFRESVKNNALARRAKAISDSKTLSASIEANLQRLGSSPEFDFAAQALFESTCSLLRDLIENQAVVGAGYRRSAELLEKFSRTSVRLGVPYRGEKEDGQVLPNWKAIRSLIDDLDIRIKSTNPRPEDNCDQLALLSARCESDQVYLGRMSHDLFQESLGLTPRIEIASLQTNHEALVRLQLGMLRFSYSAGDTSTAQLTTSSLQKVLLSEEVRLTTSREFRLASLAETASFLDEMGETSKALLFFRELERELTLGPFSRSEAPEDELRYALYLLDYRRLRLVYDESFFQSDEDRALRTSLRGIASDISARGYRWHDLAQLKLTTEFFDNPDFLNLEEQKAELARMLRVLDEIEKSYQPESFSLPLTELHERALEATFLRVQRLAMPDEITRIGLGLKQAERRRLQLRRAGLAILKSVATPGISQVELTDSEAFLSLQDACADSSENRNWRAIADWVIQLHRHRRWQMLADLSHELGECCERDFGQSGTTSVNRSAVNDLDALASIFREHVSIRAAIPFAKARRNLLLESVQSGATGITRQYDLFAANGEIILSLAIVIDSQEDLDELRYSFQLLNQDLMVLSWPRFPTPLWHVVDWAKIRFALETQDLELLGEASRSTFDYFKQAKSLAPDRLDYLIEQVNLENNDIGSEIRCLQRDFPGATEDYFWEYRGLAQTLAELDSNASLHFLYSMEAKVYRDLLRAGWKRRAVSLAQESIKNRIPSDESVGERLSWEAVMREVQFHSLPPGQVDSRTLSILHRSQAALGSVTPSERGDDPADLYELTLQSRVGEELLRQGNFVRGAEVLRDVLDRSWELEDSEKVRWELFLLRELAHQRLVEAWLELGAHRELDALFSVQCQRGFPTGYHLGHDSHALISQIPTLLGYSSHFLETDRVELADHCISAARALLPTRRTAPIFAASHALDRLAIDRMAARARRHAGDNENALATSLAGLRLACSESLPEKVTLPVLFNEILPLYRELYLAELSQRKPHWAALAETLLSLRQRVQSYFDAEDRI